MDTRADVVIVILANTELANVRRLHEQLGSTLPVVCVDSGSTDGTREFVREAAGWELYEHDYDSYGDQLNWAFENTLPARWRFVLDADEELAFPVGLLGDLVRRAEDRGKSVVAFRRRNYIGSRLLRHGGWWPDWQSRLLRDDVRYEEHPVHSYPMAGSDDILFAEEVIEHYSYRDLDHYIDKLSYYTVVEARMPVALASHRPRFRRLRDVAQAMPAAPLARFTYVYVVRQGFRDGWLGFYLALWTAFKVSVNSGRRRLLRNAELSSTADAGSPGPRPDRAERP